MSPTGGNAGPRRSDCGGRVERRRCCRSISTLSTRYATSLAGIVCNAGVQIVTAPTQTADRFETTLRRQPPQGGVCLDGEGLPSSPLSQDASKAWELWKVSAEMTGLPSSLCCPSPTYLSDLPRA
jgi:hypothetical protein